jgi:hypothetical protein
MRFSHFLPSQCLMFGRGARSLRNLCKWLIVHSEVTGVEIGTNLHDFGSEIEHVFVTEGCSFVGGTLP